MLERRLQTRLTDLQRKRQEAERQTQSHLQDLAAQTLQRKLKNETCDKIATLTPSPNARVEILPFRRE